ncbi:MAG: hypothetical protein HWE20_08330 [Gammaproteobacteria bacterium]|nr:hypothetical protein [Gammaproteobacteria bacterium]
MALWYDVGAGMARCQMASRTTDQRTAFFVAAGPSLDFVDPAHLNGPGRTVTVMNNAYPKVRPDIWCGMDDPTCYPRELYDEPFIKIMRGGYQNREIETGPITRKFNLFYADCTKPNHRSDIFKLRQHDVKFVWHRSTFMITMHILVWMGYSKIYMFGCDLNTSKQAYTSGTVIKGLTDDRIARSQRLYDETNDWLRWFASESPKHGIEVISCSPESRINEYLPYRDYRNVIGEIESRLPYGYPKIHPTDAEEPYREKDKQKAESEKKKADARKHAEAAVEVIGHKGATIVESKNGKSPLVSNG